MTELITRDDFDLPEPEYKWHKEPVYIRDYVMKNDTIESSEPLNKKPYKEIGCEDECKACPHGVLRFFTHRYGQYQSILCMASKHPTCVGGFLQKEDIYV